MKPVFILQVDADKNCEVWLVEPSGSTVARGTIEKFEITGLDNKAPMDAPVDVLLSGKWSIKEIIEKPLDTDKEKQ
jgi:hypothetical protein